MIKSLTNPERPLFLIYDPVDIIKSIRNNWITEKTQTLVFPSEWVINDEGVLTAQCLKSAKWSDLKQLKIFEENCLLRLTTLNARCLAPDNTEKQNVGLVLRIFSDKTSAALKTSHNSTQSMKDTAEFIDLIIKFWKVVNCKTPVEFLRFKDPDRIPIDLSENGDRGLQTLSDMSNIAKLMATTCHQRVKCFTADTANAIQWTCQSLIEMCEFLLYSPSPFCHQFVLLGVFQQDDIEKHFGHWRMSAGCNFFLTVKEVYCTHALDRAKFIVQNKLVFTDESSAHQCIYCEKTLTTEEVNLLDSMAETNIIKEITSDEVQALCYVAGYVSKKYAKHLSSPPASSPFAITHFLSYFEELNRGGLVCPSEELLMFVLLARCFFVNSPEKERSCRNRWGFILSDFPGLFHLNVDIPNKAVKCIVNIFCKRYVENNWPSGGSQKLQRTLQKLASQ